MKLFRPMMSSARAAAADTLGDPNSSDHIVAITELREQLATLQKQLTAKDNQLLSKEKQVGLFSYLSPGPCWASTAHFSFKIDDNYCFQ